MTEPNTIVTFHQVCEVLRTLDGVRREWGHGKECHTRILNVLVASTKSPRDTDSECLELATLLMQCAARMHNQYVFTDFTFDNFYQDHFADLGVYEISFATPSLAEPYSHMLLGGAILPLNQVVFEWKINEPDETRLDKLGEIWRTLFRYGILLLARVEKHVPTRERVLEVLLASLQKA